MERGARIDRLRGIAAALALAGVLAMLASAAGGQPAALYNLDNSAGLWQVYVDPPGATVYPILENVASPSLDGVALHLGLLAAPIGLPDPSPYSAVMAYRNLDPQPAATTFQLSTRFRYRSTANPIQAIEFTQSKWQDGLRWEWAVQWQNVGDGTPQQGDPPNWRLWNGTRWEPLGRRQFLAPDVWHTLVLKGTVDDQGQARYVYLVCDGVLTRLTQAFLPVPGPYEQLSIGVQLDGDSATNPQDVYVDYLSFYWR